ncbi:MAG: hypothetical protein JWL58_7287 [Streptosporangiaceae bacterium]|jgi:ADP-ribosylglycohydrolase|nr:hypothetical protein [Streptosporangiaceae bacterium]
MTSSPASFPQRTRGIVVCAAVGDALGWPQEIRSSIVGGNAARGVPPEPTFRAWDRNSGNRFGRYTERVNAGDYSDDAQLLMSVARSCLSRLEWLKHFTEVELPAWSTYQRGGGRAVISAAREWASGTPPWRLDAQTKTGLAHLRAYFDAGANGVAMRIAPHVIVTADQDPIMLLSRVVMDGIATHGHPRALVGALVHALALRHALLHQGTLGYGDLIAVLLDDGSWQQTDWLEDVLPDLWQRAFRATTERPAAAIWAATVSETRELLDVAHRSLGRGALANDEETLDELGCFDKTRNGAGTITAVAATYLAARTATRPLSGLLRAAFLPKADTDTLASMTASVLGALHGPDWAGRLSQDVQDSRYLHVLADQLSAVPFGLATTQLQTMADETGRPDKARPVQAADIKRFRSLLSREGGNPRRFLDGRAIERCDREELKSNASVRVDRVRLTLQDGQSLIIDTIGKVAEDPTGASQDGPSALAASTPERRNVKPRTPALFDQPGGLPPRLSEGFDNLRSMVTAATRSATTPEPGSRTERLDVEDLYRASWVQAVAVVESWILREVRHRILSSTAAIERRRHELPSGRSPEGPLAIGRTSGSVRDFDVWSEAAKVLGGGQAVTAEALRARMNLINQRRNEIVHNADRTSGGRITRSPLTAEETLDTIDWLEMFATAAWQALANQS